jgi:subtilisin family serine protease
VVPAARLLRLTLAAALSLTLLLGATVATHKAAAGPTASVAGDLRKPPGRAKVHKVAKVRKIARAVKATAAKAGKHKPKGRIAKPRPAPKRGRTPRPAARHAVPATPAGPNDPLWASSWSLAKVNAPAAWKLTNGSPETVVAVLDTGADFHHPDLEGAFVPGYDFVNHDEDPSDDHGHGTMVAGVIAARANNGIGSAGTCSRCSVMPVKVIAGNGSGNAADVALGIVWATDHCARVINLSFVLSGPDDGVAQAIAYARGRGATVVAAAGNAGTSDITFPAGLPGVVSVTGTDGTDVRYSWANYGSWVRVAAPGCSQATAPGGGYGDFCGTSSAAAFVSGLVGLARSFAAAAAPESLEQALAANAAPVGPISAGGRVDAAGILGALGPAPAAQPHAPAPAQTYSPEPNIS